MSKRIANLALATQVAATDQVPINQGTPPVSRRAPVSMLSTNYFTINDQVGSNYTAALTDTPNVIVRMNNASANTVTIPPNATVAFPIGSSLLIYQYGAGSTSFLAGSGVTLRTGSSIQCRARYSLLFAVKTDVNEWVVSGDMT